MKEKTKKILKGAGITLGAIALLGLGVGIGACSVKNGLTQPITTTPVRKGLNQRPKNAPGFQGGENLLENSERFDHVRATPTQTIYNTSFGSNILDLNSGYYYFSNKDGWGVGAIGFNTSLNNVKTALLRASFQEGDSYSYPTDWGASAVFSSDTSLYFYWAGGPVVFSGSTYAIGGLYLVDSLDIPTEDILELPDNWSPLRMVAKNVNKENNLIFDTDWNNWVDVPQANGQPMLDLSTILFKNQGRVYNHIYIYFKNLNGLKYATNSENIGTGTSSDWCADRVEYVLIDGNNLKYNYLASSVGTSILQGQNVYNLGLNWSNPNARKLEILDKRYPNDAAINNTLHGRFPRTATTALDPITNKIISPFGFGVWDYEYLFEYSNITSVDFVLGGSSDVFSIFTNAFNSVIPLLSVQVLPSISLGILLFLPLIGGIIVVIIRVIKK